MPLAALPAAAALQLGPVPARRAQGFGDPETFDSAYYQSLLKKPWLDPTVEMGSMIGLPSDHVLPEDPQLLPLIQKYAQVGGAAARLQALLRCQSVCSWAVQLNP
jgi:hypothetical protein